MKFVYFDYYTDNTYPLEKFDTPLKEIYHRSVLLTSNGVTFIMGEGVWEQNERLNFVLKLDRELRRQFNQGLSAFIWAESQYAAPWNFKALETQFKNKNLPTSIITIGGAGSVPTIFHFENRDESRLSAKEYILGILTPRESDRREPPEGWAAHRNKINAIRKKIILSSSLDAMVKPTSPRAAPSRPKLTTSRPSSPSRLKRLVNWLKPRP